MQTLSSSTSKATATTLAQVQALIAGTQKHFVNASFTLAGTSYTTATLVQTLTSLANALSAVLSAHAGVKAALTALANVTASVGPVEQAYRRCVLAAFASSPQELADFGVPAPKARAPRTSAQNAAAAAKAKATRAARGTTSKKQKLAVKGDVSGVTITPVTTPAAPAPSPAVQPAPSEPATPPKA
jgi:hypothetical protein